MVVQEEVEVGDVSRELVIMISKISNKVMCILTGRDSLSIAWAVRHILLGKKEL